MAAKFILKTITGTVLNPLFIDCQLKKRLEGYVRERWEFSGKFKFHDTEASTIYADLIANSQYKFDLFDENDVFIIRLISYANDYTIMYNHNVLEISVEKFQDGDNGSYQQRDPYQELSEEEIDWLGTYSNGLDFRITGLQTELRQANIVTTSITPPTYKNHYIYSATLDIGGGEYRHNFKKQVCRFNPSGSYSGNFFFIDDYYGTDALGNKQEPEDIDFPCYDGYYSTRYATQITDLYADCKGTPDYILARQIDNSCYLEYQDTSKSYYYSRFLSGYNGYNRLLWCDASDIKRFYATDKATENLISPKAIADIYKYMFNLEYKIDLVDLYDSGQLSKVLKLVHYSENIQSGTFDLTNYKGTNWTTNSNIISYNKEKVFNIQSYNENQTDYWKQEKYSSNSSFYVKNEKTGLSNIILDVKDLIENPDKYPDNAIVLVATTYDYIYEKYIAGIYDPNNYVLYRPNSYMNPNALRFTFKTYNHYTNETFDVTFIGTTQAYSEKTGKLNNVFAPVTFHEALTSINVTTDIGTCRIENFELGLDGSFANLTLLKD